MYGGVRRFFFAAPSLSRVNFSARWEFKGTTKNALRQKPCGQGFAKKIDQNSKTVFFSICFLSRFWAFLGEGSSKTPPKQYQQT
jgi:hypothetical protein